MIELLGMGVNVTNPKKREGNPTWQRGSGSVYKLVVAIDRDFEELVKRAALDELRSIADLTRIALRDWLEAHGYIVRRNQRGFDDGSDRRRR